jgi:hypothetical protein
MEDKKTEYTWKETIGIVLLMIQQKLAPLLQSRNARVAAYLIVALGISLIIGGAVMYLMTYGSGDVFAASSSDVALMETLPTSTPGATSTPAVAPTPLVVLVSSPNGEWTDEACRAAGEQMQAEMASFWTSPQGVGCNVLIGKTWMTLP